MAESWSPEGVILAEFDYIQIEHSRGHLVVTDGWLTNYITIYDNGSWRSDMEITNSGVISWINNYVREGLWSMK